MGEGGPVDRMKRILLAFAAVGVPIGFTVAYLLMPDHSDRSLYSLAAICVAAGVAMIVFVPAWPILRKIAVGFVYVIVMPCVMFAILVVWLLFNGGLASH